MARRWALLLALGVAAAYAPVLRGGFIWDDDLYVSENAALEKPDALRRIWASTELSQYYPVVYTSFWLERKLWGLAPAGYHGVNLGLHAANAVLAGAALGALGVPGAALGAALWALHPMQVETVAWVTERKNLLSVFFTLLSLLAYLGFCGLRPRARWQAKTWYLVSWLLFALAMLSKTTACSLPVVLLILPAWKRGRLPAWKDAVPLLPFFLLALALGLVTIWFEGKAGARGEAWSLAPAERLLLAGRTSWFYLGKLAWPSALSFVYPRWSLDAESPLQWLPAAAWAAVAAACWRLRRQGGVAVAVTAACFLALLFPALGFFQVYPFRYSFVADHFQYLAGLAVCALMGALVMRLPKAWRMVCAGVLLAGLGARTFLRCPVFFSLESLWTDTLAKNDGAWLAHNNLGSLLTEKGRLEEALSHLRKASALYPLAPETANNMGAVFMRMGRPAEALAEFRRACGLQPRYAPAQFNRGLALEALGQGRQAEQAYLAAVTARADHALAQNNLGLLLLRSGRTAEAAERFGAAIAAQPKYAQAYNNLGIARAGLGDPAGAALRFRQALRLAPGFAEAAANLKRVEP